MAIRLLSELTEFEKISLIPMSYSRINQFHDWCEAKYFFQYVVKAEQETNAAALLGNVLHKVLEVQLDKDVPIVPDTEAHLLKEYQIQLEKQDPDKIIPNNLISDGIVMIQTFVDRHTGELFPIEAKEKKFEIVIGSALITGYIDRVDIYNDRIHFIDYKSGKKEVANKNISTNPQLGIYALALQRMYPDKEIYGELYYLRSGKQKGHLFLEDDLMFVENKLVSLIHQIVETADFQPTPNSRLCNWCEYATTGLCSVGSQRVRH
jgi:RecB family exonuclease